jgi:hypothetical protein
MARLASVAKGSFYPIPADALEVLLERLRAPSEPFTVIDPCLGKGMALNTLRHRLECPPEHTFGCELDEGRAAEAKALLAGCNILAPASFLGCRSTAGSFSLVYLNPPFADELSGDRRCEYTFLVRATGWLRPGGVQALVVPEHVARSNDIRRQLLTWYDTISERTFPERCREYDEVIILAVKRSKAVSAGATREQMAWERVPPDTIYHIPPGDPPKVWEKIEYTPAELLRALSRSPLRRHLLPPAELPLPSPPLALGTGHIALLLAAGHLDGVVRPEDGPCHVVRGTASKVKYLAHEEARENADGSVTTKEVWSERINLTVRAVDGTGIIRTFTQE